MLSHIIPMCHFTLDGWNRKDKKKTKTLVFVMGNENLVSLSLSLSHKCLTNRYTTPLFFLPFSQPTELFFLLAKSNSYSGQMVHVAIHLWTASVKLKLGLSSLCWGLCWCLGQMGEKGYPFHHSIWETNLLSIPQAWLISKSSRSRTGRERCGSSVPS